jgi:Putative transposase
MKLEAEEFIRRFLLHTLPPKFAKIRHYGLYAGRNKRRLLSCCAQLLQAAPVCLPTAEEIAGFTDQLLVAVERCAQCAIGRMIPLGYIDSYSASRLVAGINSS